MKYGRENKVILDVMEKVYLMILGMELDCKMVLGSTNKEIANKIIIIERNKLINNYSRFVIK